jgi:outer membrane protein insertion porin family/translocation and assembly module TamA
MTAITRAMLATVAAAATLVGAMPAAAQTNPPLRVGDVSLIGVEALDEPELRAALATREPSRLTGWLPWTDRPVFDRTLLEDDLERIVVFYRDRGYRGARVVDHDVRIDEARRIADVTIRIEEGPVTTIETMALEGFGLMPAAVLESLRERMPASAGAAAARADIAASAQIALRALEDRGYPFASVQVREDPAAANHVRIVLRATPGEQARFGDAEVVGNQRVDGGIVRRELAYGEGDLFRRTAMTESQRRLVNLELFEFVSIEPVGEAPVDGVVPTRITVAEGNPQRTQLSFGYGTEEQVRGEITWRHVNFFGGARTVGTHAKWSSLDRGVQVDFLQPYAFSSGLSAALDAEYWRTDEAAFTVDSRGVRAALGGDPGPFWSWSLELSTRHERNRISDAALADPTLRDDLIALGLDPGTGEQSGVLTMWSAAAERSTSTNALSPARGYVLAARIEQAGGWLPGSFAFVNLHGEGRHYWPLGGGVIVASRVRLGSISPIGAGSNIPFFKRYFLGGSTSLRGWGRYEVSPLSPGGLPLGGQSLTETSIELRLPLAGQLAGTLFADAGRVGRRSWDFGLQDLLYDVGAGLRYASPIGPLRVDLGYQLTPIEGLRIEGQPERRRWRIHFSVGEAF